MAETYYLQEDVTRLEDLITQGLQSGDTIELAGKILTCESNTVAAGITGLLASGTGTIRMLDGGNVDFSGSEPLPATVTIEGGTEENPLPSYGNYGYVGRSAACIKLRNNTTFSGKIISHCLGNSNRVQFAKTLTNSTNTIIYVDRDIDWEPGDIIYPLVPYTQNTDPNITAYPIISSYEPESHKITLSPGFQLNPVIGTGIVLCTAGFCIIHSGIQNSIIIGDEILISTAGTRYSGSISSKILKLNRLVFIVTAWQTERGTFLNNANVNLEILVNNCLLFSAPQIGTNTCALRGNSIVTNKIYVLATYYGYDANRNNSTPLHVAVNLTTTNGGYIAAWPCIVGMKRTSYTDVEVPDVLYKELDTTSELIVKTTSPKTCKIYRKDGTATLRQKSNFPSPAEIPEAWQLEPNNSSCYAWHDEEQIVAPGRTLTMQWYCFIGEENTESAGMQVLDGEFPGFGQGAVEMDLADVFAEYVLPSDSPVLQWLPPKQLSWRNDSDRPRKVIIRGWCKGGQAYSRIAVVQGGAA